MKRSNGWMANAGLALAVAGGLSLGVAPNEAAAYQCAALDADADVLAHAHVAELNYARKGKAMTRRVEGVRVRLSAMEGHSAPYLQRVAACQLGEVLDAKDAEAVKVRVEAQGPHFELHLFTADSAQARRVLERVRAHTGL